MLVAFVIATLALVVLFGAVSGGLRATATAARYQEALSLARSHLAGVTAADLAPRVMTGDDGRGFHWHLRIAPLGSAGFAGNPDEDTVQAAQLQATLYAVSITVTWAGDAGARGVRLDTERLASGPARGG